MVSAYWIEDELLPFARRIRLIISEFSLKIPHIDGMEFQKKLLTFAKLGGDADPRRKKQQHINP